MIITQNFTIAEFTRSQTASEHGIDNSMNRSEFKNAQELCMNYLEPIRAHARIHLKQNAVIKITSGFRNKQVNQLVGGSPTSAHTAGRAADYYIPGVNILEVFRLMIYLQQKGELPKWDQAIVYRKPHFSYGWIHLGTSYNNRNQILECVIMPDGRKNYLSFQPSEVLRA